MLHSYKIDFPELKMIIFSVQTLLYIQQCYISNNPAKEAYLTTIFGKEYKDCYYVTFLEKHLTCNESNHFLANDTVTYITALHILQHAHLN
jgi:hypothetical protein